MKTTVKIEGLREVKSAMEGLPKATNKRAMRAALTAGGEITAKTARSLAPVDVGWLREGIDVLPRLSRRQASKHVKRAEVEVFVGPRGSSKSIVQEFGSVEQAPQAYMRPAWAMTREQVLERIADVIIVRIFASVARAAKKALK